VKFGGRGHVLTKRILVLKITSVLHPDMVARADDKAIYIVQMDDSVFIRKNSRHQFGFNGGRLAPDDPIVVPIGST
jgi:hypothetical protein